MEKEKNQEEPLTLEVELDEAITYFEKAKYANIYEKPYVPYVNLGHAYLMKGWLHKAQDEFSQALILDPGNQYLSQILESVKHSLN